jgi:hypothetical protein
MTLLLLLPSIEFFSPSFSLFAAMEVFTSAISRDVGGVGGGIVYSLINSYQHFAYLVGFNPFAENKDVENIKF